MQTRKPSMYLELQASEAVVVHAASRILASLISAGRLDESNRAELVELALGMAVELALGADRLLESDDEYDKGGGRLGPLGG
jgi:hypothetical protein